MHLKCSLENQIKRFSESVCSHMQQRPEDSLHQTFTQVLESGRGWVEQTHSVLIGARTPPNTSPIHLFARQSAWPDPLGSPHLSSWKRSFRHAVNITPLLHPEVFVFFAHLLLSSAGSSAVFRLTENLVLGQGNQQDQRI